MLRQGLGFCEGCGGFRLRGFGFGMCILVEGFVELGPV